jgi:hypothetical protein
MEILADAVSAVSLEGSRTADTEGHPPRVPIAVDPSMYGDAIDPFWAGGRKLRNS